MCVNYRRVRYKQVCIKCLLLTYTLCMLYLVMFVLLSLLLLLVRDHSQCSGALVLNTWGFSDATSDAWKVLLDTNDPISAVESGCARCEVIRKCI